MDANENKKIWETPEIADLDVRETKGGSVDDTYENVFVRPS